MSGRERVASAPVSQSSAGILLGSILDYAGAFPPARLGLAEALANYARDRSGRHAWMLGRFVLASARLKEFEELAASFERWESPWELSLVLSGEPGQEIEHIQRFNERWSGKATIVSVEIPPLEPSAIGRVARRLPGAVEAFFEVSVDRSLVDQGPLDPRLDARLAAIAASGASAKVRTGGVSADAFLSTTQLCRFISSCVEARVAFKATAGLHHALGGRYPVTYDPDSPSAVMHGFLNVCAAAALMHSGVIESREALDVLDESSAEAFKFLPDSFVWRDRRVTARDLADTRRSFFRSFGSCSFREPIEDLERLRIL